MDVRPSDILFYMHVLNAFGIVLILQRLVYSEYFLYYIIIHVFFIYIIIHGHSFDRPDVPTL